MAFVKPVPFQEAIDSRAVRTALPTTLSSQELRALGSDILRQANFSAQTVSVPYLDFSYGAFSDVAAGQLNPATFRVMMKEFLRQIDYQPEPGTAGTITDLSSDARLNLRFNTESAVAGNFGRELQGQTDAVLYAYPAQEPYRAINRKEPRNWPTRFTLAAQEAGDMVALRVLGETGRMIALKNKPIWQALGNGAGGFTDTLGNDFAPFAFASGMRTRDIIRPEAVALGLLAADETVAPKSMDLATALQSAIAVRSAGLRALIEQRISDQNLPFVFDGDTLTRAGGTS